MWYILVALTRNIYNYIYYTPRPLQISPAQSNCISQLSVSKALTLSLSLWLSTNGIDPASSDSARIVTSLDPNLRELDLY